MNSSGVNSVASITETTGFVNSELPLCTVQVAIHLAVTLPQSSGVTRQWKPHPICVDLSRIFQLKTLSILSELAKRKKAARRPPLKVNRNCSETNLSSPELTRRMDDRDVRDT